MGFERYYWFSYQAGEDNSKIHRIRDGGAFAEIAATLQESGLRYADLVFNQSVDATEGPPPPTLPADDYPHLKQTDLLVLPTRPPLSDTESERSWIRRSHTSLERSVLESVGLFFETCSRSIVKLAPGLAGQLPVKYADRAEIEFFTYKGDDRSSGAYKSLKAFRQARSHDAVDDRTSAYIVFTPALWDGGPGLLTIFGITGNMTLAWSRILRSRFPGLIAELVAAEKSRFVFAEISRAIIPERPQTLSFVDRWHCDIVLDAALRHTESSTVIEVIRHSREVSRRKKDLPPNAD